MVGFVQRINGGGSGKNTSIQCFYAVRNQGQSLTDIARAEDNYTYPTLMQSNMSLSNITYDT